MAANFDVSEDMQGESLRDLLRERLLNSNAEKPEVKDALKIIVDAANTLADAKDGFDIYDVLAILVLDVTDMEYSKDPKQFIKQKADARRTLKKFKRMFEKLTYKNFRA